MTTIPLEHDGGISPLLIPRPYRVIGNVQEAPDVHTLHVEPVAGELPSFRPAQVSMLGVFGVGEAAISISSATSNTQFHAYTIRRNGPISGALVDATVGSVITARGPFGTPWPIADIETQHLAIIGGGLGIAPLRAVIHEAAAFLDDADAGGLERVAVAYGATSPAQLLYRDDLADWQDMGVEVSLTVDNATEGWSGTVGVVPALLGAPGGIHLDWPETTAYVCGPDVMMHYTAATLERLGVRSDRIWFTLERNMQCGYALCGHCQLGPFIVCRDGPVARYSEISRFHRVPEI